MDDWSPLQKIYFWLVMTMAIAVCLFFVSNNIREGYMAHHKDIRDEYTACLDKAKDFPSFNECNWQSYP